MPDTIHSSPEGEAISRAISQLIADDPGRKVPSPSQVEGCTREVWAKAHQVPRDNFPDDTGESYIAAESGRLTESLLESLVVLAGIARVIDPGQRDMAEEQLAILGMRGGQLDAIGETPDGERILVEFKRKGAFDIVKLHQKGLPVAIPRDFWQVQSYMEMLDLKRCFYFAANWDRGALTSAQRGKPHRFSGIYTEWVERSSDEIATIKKAVNHQLRYIDGETDMSKVPRDFDPREGKWPCTWCPVLNACLRAG